MTNIVPGTNMKDAVLDGIKLLEENLEPNNFPLGSSLLVFLTDGKVTGSEDQCLTSVRNKNDKRFSMFALGFGQGVDFTFLKKMSSENKGLARKIYSGSDAAIQLKDFFSEIASPLLTDVNIEYLDNKVNNESLTTTNCGTLFNGTEIITCGLLEEGYQNVQTLHSQVILTLCLLLIVNLPYSHHNIMVT